MKYALGLVLALTTTGVLAAQQCVTTRVVTNNYVAPVVAKKFVVTEVVPVAAYAVLPLYGGAYVPPVVVTTPAPAPAPAPEVRRNDQSDLQQILTAIKQVDSNVRSIDDRVKALEAKVNGTPAQAPANPGNPKLDPFVPPKTGQLNTPKSAQAILTTHCANCHGKNSDTLGGNFEMFVDGKLKELTDRQWRKIGSKVASNKMPPEKDNAGNKLPAMEQEDYAILVQFIDSLK
jgi:cytochrome c553